MAGNTYDLASANREDLLDLITIISPTQTPFFSSVAKGTAAATLHEWLTDSLSAHRADAGAVEGADFADGEILAPVRNKNVTQIITNPFMVSRTQDQVSKAGKDSEVAYQASKKLREHARDLESACFNNLAGGNPTSPGVPGDVSNARNMEPIKTYVAAAHIQLPAAGSEGDLVEADVNDAMQLAWAAGGEVDTIFCTGTLKRVITGFTDQRHRNFPATGDSKTLVYTIDVYEGDFGMCRILADRFIDTYQPTSVDSSDVYLLEMSRWRFDFLCNPKEEPLAKTGDAYKRWIISEGCVVGLAPEANAVIKECKNALPTP